MKPLGVFDSGVGGLTVVKAIKQALPELPIHYLGDTARLPYGTKSPLTVKRYTERNLQFLTNQGVCAVVVACNTASALALPELHPTIKAWGVVGPSAERAALLSKGRVGVLATESTISSGAYAQAIKAARPELEVLSQPCPLLVPLVEEGWYDDPITREVARRYLAPLLKAEVDTLVLGCTHYPMLRPMLSELAGDDIVLIDSADAMAETVYKELAGVRPKDSSSRAAADTAVPAPAAKKPSQDRFFVTDSGERFARIAKQFLDISELDLELVEVA